MTAQPYQVVAITRRDGPVVLSSHATEPERNKALAEARRSFQEGAYDTDVKEIVRGELGTSPGAPTAEEATIASAFMAQFDKQTRKPARMKGL